MKKIEDNIKIYSKLTIRQIREEIIDALEGIILANKGKAAQVAELLNKSRVNGDLIINMIIRQGTDEDFQKLLRLGAKTNLENDFQESTLHIAIMSNKRSIANMLLDQYSPEEKAKIINSQNKAGVTPLHCAVLTNQPGLVVFLLNAGAKVNIQDQTGNTPVDIAKFYGYEKVLDVFSGKGELENLNFPEDKIPKRSVYDREL
jgi:ankyrin repeat protein